MTESFTTIRVERGDEVCRVVLDRPERLNALNDDVRGELTRLFGGVADDTSVRVVILQGQGRAFSAGMDLREPPDLPEDWAVRRRRAGGWQRLLEQIESIPQPTVAKLRGPVVGGAFLLAASCDLRIAGKGARFSIPEVALGIPLTWAGLPRLVREIGLPRTRDLVMTGRVVTADTAHDWGFVQRLVDDVDLDQATEALLRELLDMPSPPLEMTRAALNAIGRETGHFAAAWSDPDLIAWSLREPESREAALRYLDRVKKK